MVLVAAPSRCRKSPSPHFLLSPSSGGAKRDILARLPFPSHNYDCLLWMSREILPSFGEKETS